MNELFNSKTTWMCATCEVSLCTRPLIGEETGEGKGVSTHHARWHLARDLVSEHIKAHSALKDGRESRKRSRESISQAVGDYDEDTKDAVDNDVVALQEEV